MSQSQSPPQIRVAVIGAGNRGIEAYGDYIRRRPDMARIVAIADPRVDRLQDAAARHGLAPEHLYADWRELLERETGLDAVLITTPDTLHLEPALAAIRRGLGILLEKPISPTEEETRILAEAARESGADITVAHVLRYTAFFSRIKEILERGTIGRLVTLRQTEHIGYWHFAHSFVRGNWRREAESSPLILAKTCHDLDIVRWLVGAPCTELSSVGSLAHFRRENAPDGSTDRCDEGCKVERSCPYSAPRIYLEKFAPANGWPHTVLSLDTSPDGILAALHDGPYGRCVYRCDNDVVDNQVVAMRFANGVSATLNVSAFTADNTRTLHLMGTHGEIAGNLEKNEIVVTDFRTDDVTTIRLGMTMVGRHAGGDDRLMAEFLGRQVQRRGRSQVNVALASLEESLDSHFMAFAAERSRRTGTVVRL
jgi:predicted dehydrogenase